MNSRRRVSQEPQPQTFMDFVQAHERSWGTDNYRGRPDLEDLLEADVLVFWQKTKKETPEDHRLFVSIHDSLDDIEKYISRLMFGNSAEVTERQIVRIFKHKKKVIIRGVKIDFKVVEDEE